MNNLEMAAIQKAARVPCRDCAASALYCLSCANRLRDALAVGVK